MSISEGDKVLYYKIGFPAMVADVLFVSPRGRLQLWVHQGGAVPFYKATGVKLTSVTLLESSANAKGDVSG